MGIRLASAPAALLLFAFTASADEASKNAKIEQLFTLSKVDRSVQTGIDQTLDQMKSAIQQMFAGSPAAEQAKNTADLQGKISKILLDALGWDKLKPLYVKMYSEAYSEHQIDDLLAFFKTPTGQALVDKGPVLAEKGGEAAQQRLSAVMPSIQKIIKDSLPAQAGK